MTSHSEIDDKSHLKHEKRASGDSRLVAPWALFCAVVCLQFMFVGFVRFSSVPIQPEKLSSLTAVGISIYHPEKDLPMYLFWLFLAPTLACFLFGRLKKLIAQGDGKHDERSLQQGLLVVSGFSFFMIYELFPNTWVLNRIPPPLTLIACLGIAAAQLLLVLFISSKLQKTALKPEEVFEGSESILPPQNTGNRILPLLLDVVLLICIVLVIYLPNVSKITGAIFMSEKMHHWDYFTSSQTLSFLHGDALGADVYAQYGCGWTLIFSALSRFAPFGYGMLVRTTSLFESFYLFGVYLLLKEVTKSRFVAAMGVLLTAYLTIFCGIEPGQLKISYPSSTMMRHAADIWVILALFKFFKNRMSGWMILAWVLTGVSLVLETDTGIFLLIATAGTTFFTSRIGAFKDKSGRRTSKLKTLGYSTLGLFLTLAICFGAASQWRLGDPKFWVGLFEVFTRYPSGMSMLPISGQIEGMMLAAPIILTYAAGIAYGALQYRCGRSNATDEFIFLASLYGAFLFIAYIGRSHYFNIFHSCAPFVLIWAVLIWRSMKGLTPEKMIRVATSDQIMALKGFVLWLALIVIFSGSVQVREHPGLLHQLILPEKINPDLCLFPETSDVCLPENETEMILSFRRVVQTAKGFAAERKTVAFFSNDDTALYLGANLKPWGRYCRTMQALLTKEQLAGTRNLLISQHPDCIFFGTTPLAGTKAYDTGLDVWRDLHAVVESRYVLIDRIGSYEVWKFRGAKD